MRSINFKGNWHPFQLHIDVRIVKPHWFWLQQNTSLKDLFVWNGVVSLSSGLEWLIHTESPPRFIELVTALFLPKSFKWVWQLLNRVAETDLFLGWMCNWWSHGPKVYLINKFTSLDVNQENYRAQEVWSLFVC